MRTELTPAYWALRLGIGLTAFLAGADKFAHLLTNWDMYLNPLALQLIPVDAAVFMQAVGVVEMAVGVVVLSGRTRFGPYVASAWLVAIALNLVMMGRFLDVAVRDVGLSIAAFTLARLEDVRERRPADAALRAASHHPLRSEA